MAWTPIVGKAVSIPQLQEYLERLEFKLWRPSLIVWHNTAAPTLAQWRESAAKDRTRGLIPGQTRINNLVTYFKGRGWSSGPHAFVADDAIWLFTPFTAKGTHSPSWNGMSIGIEMIGDFSKEDDESGAGLMVRKNTIALTALLCEKLGLDPQQAIKLHKEDKKTDHDCPGANIARDKKKMVQEVIEYMGHAGEHVDPPEVPQVKPTRVGKVYNLPKNDTLNVRENSSASSKILAQLKSKEKVEILDEGMNGVTKWLRVRTASGQLGWASARYILEG